jgi:hypothetical protein
VAVVASLALLPLFGDSTPGDAVTHCHAYDNANRQMA